jgi:hypothetical protein
VDGSIPMFRLAKRGGDGLCCDARGVALGPVVLVETADANGRRVYRVRPAEEIARILALAYDPFSPDDLAPRLSGLDLAARALEAGDMAKAAVATVLLKLPPLSAEAMAKVARDPTLKKYSPDQPRDARGRWTSGGEAVDATTDDASSTRPVQVAANDTGVMSDSGGILPAGDKPATPDSQGVPVLLPNGTTVSNNDDNGPLMSPVGDLSAVAEAGREVGNTYLDLLRNPETADGAIGYLAMELRRNLRQGGVFDYQRERNTDPNSTKEFKQLRQFRDVSNFNVGLFCQQAGLTLDETLRIAGGYAGRQSSNAQRDQPYSLDPRQKKYIELGYQAGTSGMFGPAAGSAGN